MPRPGCDRSSPRQPEVAALPWDAKMEALAELLLTDPEITGISGVPPGFSCSWSGSGSGG